MSELLQRLKERKLVRWALAYVAGAWVVIEATGALGDMFAVPVALQRGVVVALGFGLILTLVLAWYHGEQGRQRVSGTELLIIAAILASAGATLALLRPRDQALDAPVMPTPASVAEPEPDPRSIAVLPFMDLSPERDQGYFALGVAEELRGVLARIEGLRVASSTSSLSIEDARLDPRGIGVRLGVARLVEGSVRKAGDRLRIEARVVNVADGFQLWSGRFDAEAADIFAVQDSIAQAVARALQVELDSGATMLAPRGQTTDHVAQDLYLQGRFAWNRRTREGLERAVDLFQQAVDRDSTYARALVGLGDAYAVLGFYDYRAPGEAFPLAEQAARDALAIDSLLAEPHATLGYAALYYRWDWNAAEAHFRRAIDLDRGYPVAHQWYANYLTAMGRFEEAKREMRFASELDPLSLIIPAALGFVQHYAQEYDDALSQLAAVLARDESFELAWLWAGQVHEAKGEYEEAERLIRRAVALSGGSQITRASLARTLALSGQLEEAQNLLTALEAEARTGYAPSYEVARVYVGFGDITGAIRWLERAVEERSHSIAFLAVDPQLDPLREDARFQALIDEVGLTGVGR